MLYRNDVNAMKQRFFYDHSGFYPSICQNSAHVTRYSSINNRLTAQHATSRSAKRPCHTRLNGFYCNVKCWGDHNMLNKHVVVSSKFTVRPNISTRRQIIICKMYITDICRRRFWKSCPPNARKLTNDSKKRFL